MPIYTKPRYHHNKFTLLRYLFRLPGNNYNWVGRQMRIHPCQQEWIPILFRHCNDVTWASRPLKSPVNRLFEQKHIRADNKETTKTQHYWYFPREPKGDGSTSLTKGQGYIKRFMSCVIVWVCNSALSMSPKVISTLILGNNSMKRPYSMYRIPL